MCSFQILIFNFFSLHAGVKIVIGSFLYPLHILYCIHMIYRTTQQEKARINCNVYACILY